MAPLQTTLQVPLNSETMQAGSPVFATTSVPWNGPDCKLIAGATVYGHAVEVQRRGPGVPESRMTLAFDRADCNGSKAVAAPLLLYAVLDLTAQDEPGRTRDQAGLFGAIQPHPPMSVGGQTANPGPSTTQRVRQDMSYAAAADDQKVKAGEVLGVARTTLSVGTGEGGASVLSSRAKALHLHPGLALIFVYFPRPAARVSPEAKVVETPPAALPKRVATEPEPKDETEICTAGCVVDSVSRDAGEAEPHTLPSMMVSLGSLGYRPKPRTVLEAFDDQTTVHFLGGNELLLTFDPHTLRAHTSYGWRTSAVHSVRAALFRVEDGRPERVLEWRVEGEGRYIWPAGPGRVLAHVGKELRLLGGTLQILKTIPLSGQLQWVAVSPNGEHIAVGTLQERHTEQVHTQIATLSGMEPEEDLQIRLLDLSSDAERNFMVSSRTQATVLSDDGELQVHRTSAHGWELREVGWGGGQRKVAEFRSDCEPRLGSPVDDAVFLQGCSGEGGQRWFRLLRLDGHTLLKGEASSQLVEERASGGDRQGEVAVRTVEMGESVGAGAMFRAKDVRDERITVFRLRDGSRAASVRENDFPLSEETFALSPAGDEFAVLTNKGLRIFRIDPDGSAGRGERPR